MLLDPRDVWEQFPTAHYEVDVPWRAIESSLKSFSEGSKLCLDPDFQRAHVWTRNQQIEYVRYILSGGEVAKQIIWNAPNWYSHDEGNGYNELTLIDGKQRLEAVRAFCRDEFDVDGYLSSQIHLTLAGPSFRFRVCQLRTRAEVLRLYLNINAGGTPHTKKELDQVRRMLEKEEKSG